MDSPGRPYRADWYPDPTGRFEFRYHNGSSWTADVSAGGIRYVDPVDRPQPAVAGAEHHDRLATAAMILGIVGVCLAWAPVFFVIGAVAAVLAVIFGVVARRRTPRDTRGFAGVGIVTGAAGILLAGVGVWTTVLIFDFVDEYQNPPEHVVDITECAVDGDVLSVEGTLENVDSGDGEFRVVVRIPATGSADRDVAIDVGDVDAGETAKFGERFDVSRSLDPDPPTCEVVRVTGPLPLGIDLDDFELD